MQNLETEQVFQILGHVDPEALFIAGGQALNIWAQRYSDSVDLREYGPYTSKDIDLVGAYRAAEVLAKALGGHVEQAHADGVQAWVEGIIVVPQPGKPDLRIDVLNHILGTNEKDLKDSSIKLRLPVKQGDEVVGHLPVTIMHPFHVLQSRIANVLKIEKPNSKIVTVRQRQAKAAPVILREYLRDALAKGDVDDVRGTLRQLATWLRRDNSGQQVRRFVDYDPKLILDEHMTSEQLDRRWLDNNLKKMITDVEQHRIASAQRASALAQQQQIGR